MQYLTLATHFLSLFIAGRLMQNKAPWWRFGMTLFLYNVIGIAFYVPVLFFDVGGHVLSQWRAFFSALIWASYSFGVVGKKHD